MSDQARQPAGSSSSKGGQFAPDVKQSVDGVDLNGPSSSDFEPQFGYRLADGDLAIEFADEGEGYEGEYDPVDPNDRPLLRVSFLKRDDEDPDGWSYIDGASWCTEVGVDSDPALRQRHMQYALDRGNELLSGEHGSPERVASFAESMSHLKEADL